MESSIDLYKEISGGLDVGGEVGEKIDAKSRGVFDKGEGVMEVAVELVVVGGEEEEEEGVVEAYGAVSGSSTASFRATKVEAADLGRLFWGEGTRKKKKRRKERRKEDEVRVPTRRGCGSEVRLSWSVTSSPLEALARLPRESSPRIVPSDGESCSQPSSQRRDEKGEISSGPPPTTTVDVLHSRRRPPTNIMH
ncbi:hypothetical protein TIFTF001_024926 [Ficus carica]|uniref:Uncharacterized protein n=1 Tax=Ficus carica TaxID=3494 RepID=A0AA88AYD2_FICCA|nr:hypothetical protein TIFTF001_024926 [Ficus carica]